MWNGTVELKATAYALCGAELWNFKSLNIPCAESELRNLKSQHILYVEAELWNVKSQNILCAEAELQIT